MKHVLFTALNSINKLQEIVEDSEENNARFKRGNCNKTFFNPHMHEIFLQRYCMKWVPGDPLKEMIN